MLTAYYGVLGLEPGMDRPLVRTRKIKKSLTHRPIRIQGRWRGRVIRQEGVAVGREES